MTATTAVIRDSRPLPMDSSIADVRARVAGWRQRDETVALVPTMGALHAGHLALVAAARERARRVVVSIFVNPTQFAPNEDFARYPRDEDGDLAKLADAGVDAVFAPTVAEMYPDGASTTVNVAGPAEGLETDFRPHFFAGVATVVTRLLLVCQPDLAAFGEKDYQQLLVVRRLVADLAIPVDILGCPTVRESDGLALSSRNTYLAPEARSIAPLLHRALETAATAIRAGQSPRMVVEAAEDALTRGGFAVDYVALRNADTLHAVADPASEPMRLLAAARLGGTRLIDNVPV